MTVKTVVTLAVGLLMATNQPTRAAGEVSGIELAREKTEIHLVGSGRETAEGRLLADAFKKAFASLSKGTGAKSKTALRFQISWVEDRQLLLHPLLTRKVFDFGFGFEKPDCSIKTDNDLCRNFFFSRQIVLSRAAGNAPAKYAIIAKSHPRARTLLYYLNTALSRLSGSAGQGEVVSRQPGIVSE